ncbi:early endosome antigen 1-like [Ostrinia nubilalis]|uniref:early endosome antigen 1-like n=1 Tax=Ostrinia nubilalis TaxID=29057 RepID=UPI00308257E5
MFVFKYVRKYLGMGLPDLTEVRAERDVLQARMSEQALKISSLSARLQQQRNDAEALAHHASSQLSVQLHDARAEVQKLKEDLESKDKQLHRLKQNLDEKDKLNEQHQSLYGNSCNPKDKVVILERELSSAQTRIAQLEAIARGLEADKDELNSALRDHQRALAEKEEQLQELLALKLDDDNQREKSEDGGKASARTLSDIVSISEFDEQDLQMRRAELKGHNTSLTGAPHASDSRDKMLNRTLPPELSRPNMSSLNIEYIDSLDAPHGTPRADSLPAHLTSTQNKDRYKRNVNETMMFGTLDKFGESVKHSTAQNIPDNCSMYPNRDVSDSKDHSVEPKKINFSVEPSHDNRTHDEEEFTSLRELGISLDIRQENFPDILTQLKHEIKKSRAELEICKSELKNAEEQLCEFPALKEEVEELKGLLENTMATMETDKKFYENQLENFSSNKKLLEQRLTELTQEVGEKSKDLHLLKEDILRRENMILELAKEKRNLTNKMTELEVKIDELQSRNNVLEKCETENHQLREKLQEMQKLEQLVSEKNHQIDSLNQHLDRLDDLQRCLNDKTEELENLKEALEEKSSEVFQMQDTVEALNRDIAKLNEHNNQLNDSNKELKLKLSKLEKEQENASLKLQSSESELERANSLNNELTSKIDELKLLTDKLKDKETEIEILHEDINAFHEEIASLKEQMKMVSRSPSPRSKNGDDKKVADRQASNDKKQLVKIRKQISLLQHELDFNKKELNDKAFELAKAKLDVTELRNNLGQAAGAAADKELATARLQHDLQTLAAEKEQLAEQLMNVSARIREESNTSELKAKLREKTERCQELENELQDMKELVDRLREAEANEALQQHSSRALVVSGSRSPTAELERALRDQLNYSHSLDDDICEQVSERSVQQQRAKRAAAVASAGGGTAELERALRDQLNYSHSLDDDICEQVSERSVQQQRAKRERAKRAAAASEACSSSERSVQQQRAKRAAAVASAGGGTAELERALRDQLNYSHSLDDDICEQILSASSDDREDIPRLALNISKSSSSIHSSSSERLHRLRADNDKLQVQVNNLELRLRDKDALITELNSLQHSSERLSRLRADNDKLQMQVNNLELRLRDKDALITELNSLQHSSERLHRLRADNDKLQMQVNNLELRLRDKDALITELNRIRDKLSNDWQTSKLRYEAERDNVGRLQLLLHTHKETAESLQNQDSNMIQILKKRLESAMQSEVDLQQQLQHARTRVAHLERQLLANDAGGDDAVKAQLQHELDNNERLRGEISVLKSKLELERGRVADARASLEHVRARGNKELDAAREHATAVKNELADAKRLKHEASVELLRAKELLNIQSDTITELEKKLMTSAKQRPMADTLTEIETHKSELSREIAALKKCLADAPQLQAVRAERDMLQAKLQQQQQLQQQQLQQQQQPDERDQAATLAVTKEIN